MADKHHKYEMDDIELLGEKGILVENSVINQCSALVPNLIGKFAGKRISTENTVINHRSRIPLLEKCEDKVHITELPAEIFQHILRYLTFDNIAKLRLVSRYFNNMCSALLNSEFNRLRTLVQHRFMSIKAQMPRRESSRRKHPLARESDIIETLYMRLTLLNMTFGKHIERKYCCFFAGEIIDEIYKILQYVQSTPSLSRAYKVTDELFDLSTMAMEYFKEHIEPSLPEVTYFASDVFEHPTLSSVKAHNTILEETAASNSAETPHQSSHSSLQTLNKRLKLVCRKVNRNSKEITNLKRTVKVVSQKINSLGEVINQMKWQQKSCDTTTLPDSRKMNDILVQLNLCKHEIELLTSKLTNCSEKNSKYNLKSIETSLNSSGESLNFKTKHNCDASIGPLCVVQKRLNTSDVNKNKGARFSNCPSHMHSFKAAIKRKVPSCTVTSSDEWSACKRRCSVLDELNDSNSQEEQDTTNS